MENHDLTAVEIQLIRALHTSKTDREIAEIIEKPFELVHRFICFTQKVLPEERHRAENDILAARPKPKEKKKSAAQLHREKQEEKKSREHSDEFFQRQRRAKERSKLAAFKTFETKVVDIKNLISVRIDRRTWLFVKPGSDIEAIKKQYSKVVTD